MARVALFGATGYLGTVIEAELRRGGHHVTPLRAVRLRVPPGNPGAPHLGVPHPGVPHPGASTGQLPDLATVEKATEQVTAYVADEVDGVALDLLDHDVAVNAAGLPSARGRTPDELHGANAAWPLLLALACAEAGVPRLVHLSSTAVQGMAPVLDERDSFSPMDAYGASRVRGEQVLGAVRGRGGPQITVYRIPSLYGAGRRPSYPLASLPRRLPLVMVGDGSQPVAAAHVDAVAAGVATLVGAADPPTVVTHPAEGHTVRSIYQAFEPGRPVLRVPGIAVRAGMDVLARFDANSRAAVIRRRLGLALRGQRQAASWLTENPPALPVDAAAARL
ncbi:NAD-dependent epimerase/dehydratase family protein [Parafrankia sp. FMc2]|uniref:NAD-dependent epimerase/dehydratase family protein n=1 Tax=Parafrankia sp. FMc2 TaxID=3233196 RepID=UPI0034D5AD40